MLRQAIDRLCHLADRMERMLERMTDVQAHLDADVAGIAAVLSDFADEWQRISTSTKTAAPQLDFTRLDALANQARMLDANLKSGTGNVTAADTTGAAGTVLPNQATDSVTGVTSRNDGTPTENPNNTAAVGAASPTGEATTEPVPDPATVPVTGPGVSQPAAGDGGQAAAAAAASTTQKPLYTYNGSGTPDPTTWPKATVETTDGKPLYNFSGDTAGSNATGASADWTVYTGDTKPVA